MPSLNIADTVKSLMAPSNTPAKQLNLIEDRGWDDYFDQRYASYGRSARSAYDAWEHGWNSPVKSTTPMSPRTQVVGHTAIKKEVRVQHKDGTLQTFTIPHDTIGWFDIAKQVYPYHIDKGVDYLVIPADRCQFTYGEPAFNACVYTATMEYISARWGRKLDDSDRRWLAKHPLATDAGIPQEYTITAIQQLVAPYGMRVSCVRIRAGALVLGDQNMQWAQALGCNPLALSDRRTSNADAATAFGMEQSAASALWRLEFSDTPLPGSIVGERGWSSTGGVSVGAYGGHARYLAPRATAGDWFVSIQLAPEHEVEYLAPPPDPDYIERKGAPTLVLSKTVTPSGELIAVREGTTWRSGFDIKASIPGAPSVPEFSPPAEHRVHTECTPHGAAFMCALCNGAKLEIDRCYSMTDVSVCIDCAEDAWHDIACPECNHVARWDTIPYPLSIGDNGFDYQCQACKAEFTIPFESKQPYLEDAIEFSYAAFDSYPNDLMDLNDNV